MGATHNDHTTQSSHNRKYAAQSGQAIVLIALAMVGLIGFTGLALDGGSLLFLQRKAQTVAEMAAMSAAVMACDNGSADNALIAEAIRIAGLPGNDIDSEFLDPQPQVTRAGDWTDIAVTVKVPKPSYFIHIVYKDDLIAQGYSVARCSGDAASVANPYADAVLFATSEDCDNTFEADGNGAIYSGSIRSNRNFDLEFSSGGPASAATVTITGTANYVNVADGNRDLVWAASPQRIGGYYSVSIAGYPTLDNGNPNDTSDRGLLQGPVQEAPLLYDIDDFAPGGAVWNSLPENRRYSIAGSTEGNQWQWPNICPTNPDACRLLPTWNGKVQGLYFVNGDFIATGTGNMIDAVTGDGVTIVATGRIKITGPGLYMTPYYDNLQMMSGFGADGGYQNYEVGTSITTGGTCGDGGNWQNHAIHLPPGDGVYFGTEQRPGLIYAPWGRVHFGTGNVGPSHGQIIAYTINTQMSRTAIYYGPTASAIANVTSPLDVYFTQ